MSWSPAAWTGWASATGSTAAIATHDPDTATRFMDAYGGSGVFWNSTTRLLDGFKLLRLPETGISIDRVPGPRGPVTYRDRIEVRSMASAGFMSPARRLFCPRDPDAAP